MNPPGGNPIAGAHITILIGKSGWSYGSCVRRSRLLSSRPAENSFYITLFNDPISAHYVSALPRTKANLISE
jgi:hypothetical protein